MLLGARLLFFMNAKFSEEFTGGIKITVDNDLADTQIEAMLSDYLTEQGYTDSKIGVSATSEQTVLSIVTKLQDDEKVAALSKGVQDFLVGAEFIHNADQILEQSIT